MRLKTKLGIGAVIIVAGGVAVGLVAHQSAMIQAERAYAQVATRSDASLQRFDPQQVADQPEIARRYFNHAIAPGTPLKRNVRLAMRGTFLLGNRDKYQTYSMTARQVLRPPHEFVWIPKLRSDAFRISGSDALVGGRAWTSFWLMNIVPVANVGTSRDMVRSATFRAAMEGVWSPASLLPQNRVEWEQVGPDTARVSIRTVEPEIFLELTLSPEGALREVTGQRWSDANRDKVFRLQPFGGTIEAEATFEGFTVPSRLKVGNHFGTEDYLPFFQAELTRAEFF